MFLIAVALLFILMTVLLQFYFRYNTLFLKAACTSVGVMLSLWAVLKKADVFSILVFCALLLCMAADVILELRFVIGMLVFLCGHLFLIAALLQFAQPQWVSLLLGCFFIAALSSCSANIFHSWGADFSPSWFIRLFYWACFH